ncbi:hypothetical protein BLL52_0041 [Rhodoferax antarcticus ANT.BR]|uniref:Uncharacterized protein n=2 Tax=Rhodoferax antarcticus TaxID=81479 RepID=A0A1Q8YKG2_9BURK|nr:hypothetical protein RA876_14340 [Rhodoferax antarcticus]OLP08437.1 hypothetical protein BLL52_0041 [Rhodoferax antarcticus ANT.BR]
MYGVDPRAVHEVADEHGDCVDLTDDESVLQSSLLSGDLIGYIKQLNAPDRDTQVSVVSLVPWLRAHGYSGLAGELDTTQNTVDLPTQAPPAAISPAVPDPERRLAKLIELGGTYKYRDGKWHFTGIGKLENFERNADHKRCSQKTIRDDLIEAAQSERDLKQAGALRGGLGQR